MPVFIVHRPVVRVFAASGATDVSSDDVLTLTLTDSVESISGLEIVLKDWDGARRVFTYSEGDLIKLGARVQVCWDAKDAAQTWTGEITSIAPEFPSGGAPTLTASARLVEPRRPSQAVPSSTFRVVYGAGLSWFKPTATAERGSSNLVRITATGSAPGEPRLRAGSRIEIVGVGAGWSGVYAVTATTHTLDGTGYQTRFSGLRTRPA